MFSAPVRWAIRVLALIAVLISAYLTYTSLGHSTVAGCGGEGQASCDEVMGTVWSRWLGIPVAAAGLPVYAALLVLSFFLGRDRPLAERQTTTLLVLLSLVAAGAGVWFTTLQLTVIQKVCPYCMGVHFCGIVIVCLVLWSVLRHGMLAPSTPQRTVAPVAAMPNLVPRMPVSSAPATGGLSWAWALSGAGAVLMLLIGGQFLFPAKTFDIQEVALEETTDFSASPVASSVAQAAPTDTAQTHVVHRMPTNAPDTGTPQEAEPASTAGDARPAIEDPQVVTASAVEDDPPVQTAELTVARTAPAANVVEPEPDEAEAAPVDEGPRPERKVTFLNGTLTIDMYQSAVLGSPEAPHVVLELMDYTCPHCRKANRMFKEARKRYGDQLAVVVMPVPLERRCNKYVRSIRAEHRGACKMAELSMAIAMARPEVFPLYHDWLLADEEEVPPLDKVIIRAYGYVDAKKLRALSDENAVNRRISQNIELFYKLGKQRKGSSFGLPVQIVGDTVLSGKMDAHKAFAAWEKELGIESL